MDHQDAEITEMVIILARSCEGNLGDTVELLKRAGVDVLSTDEDNFVVNGTIESIKVPTIQKLDCVNYIRMVQTYIADYPTSDPRNLDGDDEEPEQED